MSKAYLVEYGAYEEREVERVFLDRAEAEAYVIDRYRREYPDGLPKRTGYKKWDRPAKVINREDFDSFDEWAREADDSWGLVGDVREVPLGAEGE